MKSRIYNLKGDLSCLSMFMFMSHQGAIVEIIAKFLKYKELRVL